MLKLPFDFFPVVNLQIVECRRVLKWTYAYGYYLPDLDKAKRQFFEYLQGILILVIHDLTLEVIKFQLCPR